MEDILQKTLYEAKERSGTLVLEETVTKSMDQVINDKYKKKCVSTGIYITRIRWRGGEGNYIQNCAKLEKKCFNIKFTP